MTITLPTLAERALGFRFETIADWSIDTLSVQSEISYMSKEQASKLTAEDLRNSMDYYFQAKKKIEVLLNSQLNSLATSEIYHQEFGVSEVSKRISSCRNYIDSYNKTLQMLGEELDKRF